MMSRSVSICSRSARRNKKRHNKSARKKRGILSPKTGGDCPTTIPPKSLLSDRKRMEGGLSDRVGGILSDSMGVGLSDSIHKSQLKPKKRTWSRILSQNLSS